jgi:hypothetical protein
MNKFTAVFGLRWKMLVRVVGMLCAVTVTLSQRCCSDGK